MSLRYQQQLETLASSSHSTYLLLSESGMFWVWFPWATGVYEADTKRAQEKLTDLQHTEQTVNQRRAGTKWGLNFPNYFHYVESGY